MKIVIINGEGRVGKDTFVHFCSQIDPYIVYGVSIIDEVKAGAVHFNWNREDKSEKARKFLSDLKDAWEEFNDGPYETVKWRIGLIEQIHEFQKNLDKVIVFIHSREPDDIERFVNDYKAITLLIRRPEVEGQFHNHADSEVYEWGYDYIIENRDLTEFKESAMTFINAIMEDKE